LDAAREDLLAFAAFPRETWRQIWSNNRQERWIASGTPPTDPPPRTLSA
jgi:transposase-like protein